MPSMPRRLPALTLFSALLVASCAPPPAARAPIATTAAPGKASPQTVPQVHAPRFVDTTGGARLAGNVRLRAVDHAFFEDNLAAFRLTALPLASRNALVTLTTLEEDLYATGGATITARTGADGLFDLATKAPLQGPFVVAAGLAQGHRLTTLALPGETSLVVDEASSLIAEMARWQIRSSPAAPGQRSLQDLDATALATLRGATNTLFDPQPFTPTGDAVPYVAALQTGAGNVLRNLYVQGFGKQVAPLGTNDTDPSNVLSDAWKQLLGFRPLALTRVVGNGAFSFGAGDGQLAADTPLLGPVDAVSDAAGNLYITEEASNLIRYVPVADQAGPLLARAADMQGGCAFTLAGQPQGTQDLDTFNTQYAVASAASPDGAPAVTTDLALFRPQKLVLEPAAGGLSHLYFTTGQGQRLMMIPAEDVTRCGRALKAGLLYTLAGTGVARAAGPLGNGAAATAANLAAPRGLARDAQGNFYMLEKDAGLVRFLRNADGLIFTLPLTSAAAPFTAPGAADLRLSPDGLRLVVADTTRHFVFSAPTPSIAEIAAFAVAAPPATRAITRVLGNPGVGGFLDIDLPGVKVPEPADLGRGIAESGAGGVQVLLESPVSLDFDAAGNMLVADRYRVRLLAAADQQVYTLAGGFDTRYLEGDSRLAFLPQTSFLNYHAASGTFLLTDLRENLVRRLWTTRGAL
ncbi:MAG: repeat containing protein [Cyanobacteria bacterium RYN_339]|nr:repeat containing protein [Cyanobacteria bacterium RYN_339]